MACDVCVFVCGVCVAPLDPSATVETRVQRIIAGVRMAVSSLLQRSRDRTLSSQLEPIQTSLDALDAICSSLLGQCISFPQNDMSPIVHHIHTRHWFLFCTSSYQLH